MKKKFFSALSLLLVFVIAVEFFPLVPQMQVNAADAQDQTANTDIVRSLKLSYKLNGGSTWTELTSPYSVPNSSKIEAFHADYSMSLKETAGDDGAPVRTVKAGDYYLIDLPDNLNITNGATGSIKDGTYKDDIATYSLVTSGDGKKQVKVVFTNVVDDPDRSKIYGALAFDFALDLSSVPGGQTQQVVFPIDGGNSLTINITKPEPPKTTPTALTKSAASYDETTRMLVWKVDIAPADGTFEGCTFTDKINTATQELVSVKHGNAPLTQGTDYTYNSTTGELSYTIPEGRNGSNYQSIYITTKVKGSVYATTAKTTISNTASLTGGAQNVDITSNTATQTIAPDWLKKDGTLLEGNKIKWTITANTTRQTMYDVVITDSFQKDISLETGSVYVGSTNISVYASDSVPAGIADTTVYGVYTKNGDGTSKLEIHLPRGIKYASNAAQTISLITDILDKATDPSANPSYKNTASMTGNFVTEGAGSGTIPGAKIDSNGVAVPVVWIDKSHENFTDQDKSAGTITWDISAASNLSEYGQSQVVDTLPNNQTFVTGGVTWLNPVSGNYEMINDATNPKAVISGQTLTITFTDHKALATTQKFKVKTKINPSDYNKNLNGVSFDNTAEARLYEVGDTTAPIAKTSDKDSVQVTNTVIAKTAAQNKTNSTGQGQNPRVDYTVTINANKMPLSNVAVTDDLNQIATQFQKSGDSSWTSVSGVKWTYVPGTLKITRNGSTDNFNLASVISSTETNYTSADNKLNLSFGNISDSYTITFTAEMDISQNDIFRENGTIRNSGNTATITAPELTNGSTTTPGTGNVDSSNTVLQKTGKQNGSQILWTIRLNQHQISLKPLENPQVQDILPLGLTLDPTSVKLYKNVIQPDGTFLPEDQVGQTGKGTPVTDFNYTYAPATGSGTEGRYTLTLNLPDNQTAYILQFATDIDESLYGKHISNQANYVGEIQTQDNTNTSSFTLSSYSSGGSTLKTSISVKKTDKETGAGLADTQFSLYWMKNGSEPVFVRTLSTQADGSVAFRGLTIGEQYQLKEIVAPKDYRIGSPAPVTFTAASGSGQLFPFENTRKTGTLQFTKTDGTNPLPGATFQLTGNGVEQTAVSGPDGKVTFENVPYGDGYTITETAAPTGYKISADPITNISIHDNADRTAAEITGLPATYANAPLGSITVTKVAKERETDSIENAKTLSGVSFTLNGNGITEKTAQTGADGTVVFTDLPMGTYTLHEQAAPNGYAAAADQTITLTNDSSSARFYTTTVVNVKKLGELSLKKTDAKTATALAGAEFTLYYDAEKTLPVHNADGTVAAVVSGSDGIVKFTDIPYGNYYAAETKAPEGYLLSDEALPVSVTEESYKETQTLTVTNHKAGVITVTKIDADTPAQTLSGALFQLYDSNGNPVGTPVATGEDGTAVFKGLAYGTYTVKEVKAPRGYLLGSIPLTAGITEDSTTFAAAVPNKKILGAVQVLKTSRKDKPLAGAEFTLYGADGTALKTAATGEDGTALFDALPAGSYTVKETKAPENFRLSDKEFQVSVTAENNGTTQKITAVNLPMEGFDDDGLPLAGPESPEGPGSGDTPKTGESRSMALPLLMAAAVLTASFALLGITAVRRKRTGRAKHYGK